MDKSKLINILITAQKMETNIVSPVSLLDIKYHTLIILALFLGAEEGQEKECLVHTVCACA